jgi:hypothetical protein
MVEVTVEVTVEGTAEGAAEGAAEVPAKYPAAPPTASPTTAAPAATPTLEMARLLVINSGALFCSSFKFLDGSFIFAPALYGTGMLYKVVLWIPP